MNKHLTLTCVCVFALAFVAATGAVLGQGGFNRPVAGDGPEYMGVARSLASGRGYILAGSPWPNSPDMARLPLWPALLTPAARLFPRLGDGIILRSVGVLVQSLTAVLLALLAYRLWPDYRIAGLAGVMFALYPSALGLMDGGFSEASFVLVTTAGLLLLFDAGWKQMAGALILGTSVLARSNMIILPFLVAGLILLFDRCRWRYWKRGLLFTLLFLVPACCWIIRNYFVSGEFPILTSVEGETLYGGNNPVVANDLEQWGYWVFPDRIPGEPRKQVLAKQMSETQLDHYYHHQAVDFIKRNWLAYPRLTLGKLIRGFVPVPWVPLKSSLFAFFIRFLLYVGTVWALYRGVIKNDWLKIFLAAVFLATLAATVIFCGTFRYTFCIEPFLMICVAAQLVLSWDASRIRRGFRTPAFVSPAKR